VSWIVTASGIKFPVADNTPAHIRLDDIAHALSRLCRFGGHVREFYSVAQHSVLVGELVRLRAPGDRTAYAWALMHDAAEAYLGDVVSPLKRYLPSYADLELHVLRSVAGAFGLPLTVPPVVKACDAIALALEARDLCHGGGGMHAFVTPTLAAEAAAIGHVPIRPLDPVGAEAEYLWAWSTATAP
jgi:hypothetical protein